MSEPISNTSPIAEALEARRVADGLSGEQFARKLGISPAMWSRVRAGKLSGGRAFVLGVLRAYPDLAELLQRKVAA